MNDDNQMGDSDKGVLDVEGKIRAKEREIAEVLRDRKEKTEKRKVKGGEGVAIDKGKVVKKREGREWIRIRGMVLKGRMEGRIRREREGKAHIQRRIKRWRLGREREREVRHIRIKEKMQGNFGKGKAGNEECGGCGTNSREWNEHDR